MQRQRGLTLLELLVVLAIIGIAMAGVSLSLRPSPQVKLEREAQRLVAVLEAARAQSRTSGVPLMWQAHADGFSITPVKPLAHQPQIPTPRTEAWLTAGTQATIDSPTPNAVVLGPEPILAPIRITLRLVDNANTQAAPELRVGTTGLAPFRVENVKP
jgi:general secretion pathway protein H